MGEMRDWPMICFEGRRDKDDILQSLHKKNVKKVKEFFKKKCQKNVKACERNRILNLEYSNLLKFFFSLKKLTFCAYLESGGSKNLTFLSEDT